MASSLHSFLKKTPEWVEILAEHLPQVESLVTEDDTPVDHLLSAKQQRLLVGVSVHLMDRAGGWCARFWLMPTWGVFSGSVPAAPGAGRFCSVWM